MFTDISDISESEINNFYKLRGTDTNSCVYTAVFHADNLIFCFNVAIRLPHGIAPYADDVLICWWSLQYMHRRDNRHICFLRSKRFLSLRKNGDFERFFYIFVSSVCHNHASLHQINSYFPGRPRLAACPSWTQRGVQFGVWLGAAPGANHSMYHTVSSSTNYWQRGDA